MKYLKLFKIHSDYEDYINGEAVLPNVSYTKDVLKVYYNPIQHDYSQDYFTMVVTTGGDVAWAGRNNNALSYSKDNGKTWSEASDGMTLSVNEGDKVLWKGETTSIDYIGIGTFSGGTDVRYTVEGNIMSLLFGDDFKEQTSLEGTFGSLFFNNYNLTSAEKLSLPSTTLVNNCYYRMFYGCSRLVTAPVLPATTLTPLCYYEMFYGCVNLNYIKCLATNITDTSLTTWVTNVASTGTFVKASSMTSWPTGTSGIPTGWTVVDA